MMVDLGAGSADPKGVHSDFRAPRPSDEAVEAHLIVDVLNAGVDPLLRRIKFLERALIISALLIAMLVACLGR